MAAQIRACVNRISVLISVCELVMIVLKALSVPLKAVTSIGILLVARLVVVMSLVLLGLSMLRLRVLLITSAVFLVRVSLVSLISGVRLLLTSKMLLAVTSVGMFGCVCRWCVVVLML